MHFSQSVNSRAYPRLLGTEYDSRVQGHDIQRAYKGLESQLNHIMYFSLSIDDEEHLLGNKMKRMKGKRK